MRTTELAAAYEGVDELASFTDRASLERYRAALLQRITPQVDFLLPHMPPGARVLEIACGNGRLLIELTRRGAVNEALGIDLARSRIAFAEDWATEVGCECLEFAVGDALEYRVRSESFDAALCVTGAFAYFDPIAAASLALKLHGALRAEGLICLELYPQPRYRRLLAANGGEIRVWTELPGDDPWRFYLSQVTLDESGETITHQKTFIHRISGLVDAGRQERLRLYTQRSATEALVVAGFRDIEVHEGWSSMPYADGEVMVLTARK